MKMGGGTGKEVTPGDLLVHSGRSNRGLLSLMGAGFRAWGTRQPCLLPKAVKGPQPKWVTAREAAWAAEQQRRLVRGPC